MSYKFNPFTGTFDEVLDIPPRVFSNPNRGFNTPFLLSNERDAQVRYVVESSATASVTLTGSASASVEVLLQIRPAGSLEPWQNLDRVLNEIDLSVTISLVSIALSETQTASNSIGGIVPAGYEARFIRNITGDASAFLSTIQWEVLV